VTEFNRYGATPIEIDTPALRALVISGSFSADDTESFVAFLRSLDGVRVEVTANRIRVTQM
jgi:transmembrane sensor